MDGLYQENQIFNKYLDLNGYAVSLFTMGEFITYRNEEYVEAYNYLIKACPIIEVLYSSNSLYTKRCYDKLLSYY